ncbi:MAG TPA: methyltransferase [Dongiaceae bacterium]|nr:methyltransferase [Dongiaceae bacterium]
MPPFVTMLEMLGGQYIVGALASIAELQIPDLVKDGPKSAAELAEKVGANPQNLFRLMRAAASVGVLAEGADGKFAQTPLSEVLCSDAKPSLRGFAAMHGREWLTNGWGNLTHTVRTGKRVLAEQYGNDLFQFFAQNPEEAKIFNQAMTDLSAVDGPALASTYSFEGLNSVVDIGGGVGLLLATVLHKNPHLRGTLMDMPHVIESAKTGPLHGVLDRCGFVSGDMFKKVPVGHDAYMMRHIIHDWPDDRCIQLLKACREAVNPGGKLLVIDSVIDPGNEYSPSKFLDLQMMLFPGGRERMEHEFAALFEQSGWKLNRVIKTAALDCWIEGVPG